MELEREPIRSSSTRPQSFLNADREMAMMLILWVVAITFVLMSWDTTAFALGLLVVGMFVLRLLYKSDPLMRFVYIRHLFYQKRYLARSTPFRVNKAGLHSSFSRKVGS